MRSVQECNRTALSLKNNSKYSFKLSVLCQALYDNANRRHEVWSRRDLHSKIWYWNALSDTGKLSTSLKPGIIYFLHK